MSRNGVKEMTLIPADEPETNEQAAQNLAIRESGLSKSVGDAGMLPMIERLAANPDFDVAKLQKLIEMQEHILARNAEQSFNEAMTMAQKEMRPIAADASNPQTRSKYASYAQLDRALRPIYTEHGFGVSYDTADTPLPEHIRVLAYVTHNAGHVRTYRVDMPNDGKGAKGGDVMTKTHATGAAMSYGMRYLLKMIWNVAVGEDDRDGNEPVERPKPPTGFDKYWKQLSEAAAKGSAALEAVWACSQDEPYKTYRKYIASYGQAEMAALKVQARKVGA